MNIFNRYPVLIAEIGVNFYDLAEHECISNMEAAKYMIDEAKDCGITVVEFQSYNAESIVSLNDDVATESQYESLKRTDGFGVEEYRELAEYCQYNGMKFLSTPLDFESADYLDSMMNVYKISSSDLSNLPFIEHQARKDKPILLSVGASNLPEIEAAVDTIRRVSEQPIVLLHCVLEYPTPLKDANLLKILSLKRQFPELYIGYSDHTKPTDNCDVIKTAYNLGALCVEKHFTLDKTLKGNDHYHAMDPDDARRILAGIEELDIIRGSGELNCLETEMTARANARRSIVSNGLIEKGTIITDSMLTFKRPGTGISPDRLDEVVGKEAVVDIEDDTIISLDMLKEPEEADEEALKQ